MPRARTRRTASASSSEPLATSAEYSPSECPAASFGAGDTVALVLADLDGDHDLDVAVGNLVGASTVWLNDGAGSFTDSLQSLGSGTTEMLCASDLDGDGDLDLFASHGLSGLHAWMNDGDANYSDAGLVGDATAAYETAAADFDRDGDVDVVVASGGVSGERVELHD